MASSIIILLVSRPRLNTPLHTCSFYANNIESDCNYAFVTNRCKIFKLCKNCVFVFNLTRINKRAQTRDSSATRKIQYENEQTRGFPVRYMKNSREI